MKVNPWLIRFSVLLLAANAFAADVVTATSVLPNTVLLPGSIAPGTLNQNVPTIPSQSISLPPSLMISASNGASRGGGNGLVCFSKNSSWPGRIGADGQAHAIPSEALSEIESIQMLDLSNAIDRQDGHNYRREDNHSNQREIIPPRSSIAQVTAEDWKNDRSRSEGLLEAEFERYVGRYKDAIPAVFQSLQWAQAAIPLSTLEMKNAAIAQIDDFQSTYEMPKNCVMSTLFNQSRDGNTGSWEVDSRLYFHPRHPFLSQITALLHERIYYLGRVNFYQNSNSLGTYFFTWITLTSHQIYKDALQTFKDIFDQSGGVYISLLQLGPNTLLSSIINGVLQSAQGSRDIRVLGPVYLNTYRSVLLSTNLLDEHSRKTADANLTKYFVKGLVPNLIGWPVDISLSEIPLP